jgi:flagella basal body P-ring formation protein FlgA
MRHFLWPLLLISFSAGDVQREIVKYLEQYYPLQGGQYICDAAAVNIAPNSAYDSVAVDGFGKDIPQGLVVAKLSFYSDGILIDRENVSVKIGIIKPVLVTSRIIRANEPITADNVTFQSRDVASVSEPPICDIAQTSGMVATHYLPVGRSLTNSMIMTPPTMKVGDNVTIKYSHGPLSLTADGVARENGSVGDRIKVSNTLSRKIITAVIVDNTTVAIGDKEEF